MTDEVKLSNDDGVLTVTMARPEKRNALTNDMYRILADALASAETDPAVRVLLLCGEGDMYTSGNDIGDFAAVASGKVQGERHVFRFLRGLAEFTKPIVAAVQGRAVGIGTTMLLHCDIVVLAEGAKLSTPFVSLALVPEAASSILLPTRIGHLRAFEMFALGEPIDAASALAWGLANRVVPLATLRGEALTVARKLAEQPVGSLIATKRLMRDSAMIKARIESESTCFAERLNSAEAKEAFAAFAERRPANFRSVAG
ncbi:MAG: enoyl-CoA hydratase [Burkholderiales bacterium]|nr:enoyl-CoA hydratase [Burkholderiales bacterium]